MPTHFLNSCTARYYVPTLIFLLFLLIIFGISSLAVNVSSAETLEAGVKPGDWIEYELNWTLPPREPPYPLKIRREILAVNGSTLKVKIVQEMSDGSVENSTRKGDFIEGTGAAALIFIPPGLQSGDFVSIEGFGVVLINGTDQRTYLNTERTVLWSDFSEIGFDILVFWDRETGVALEMHTDSLTRAGVTTIVASNLWNSESGDDGDDNYNLLGLGTVLLIIAIVSVALLLRRRHISSSK